MSKGFWAGDSLASGLEIASMNNQAAAQARSDAAHFEALNKEIETLVDANAGNLAEKHALRVALEKLDPTHPLLTNPQLREQLHSTATRVYYMGKSWTDVARYGQKLKY